MLAVRYGITGEIMAQGRGRCRAPAEIYLFDFIGLRDFFFFNIFFFSSLKCPLGNCSPWNINAAQDAGSLKCHLAVIPPALIIPWGALAPIPLRLWGSPTPPCRSASASSPRCFSITTFHHHFPSPLQYGGMLGLQHSPAALWDTRLSIGQGSG